MKFYQPMVNGQSLEPMDGDPRRILYDSEHRAKAALTDAGHDVSKLIRSKHGILFDDEQNICIAIIHI